MAGSKSNFVEDGFVNRVLRNQAFASPATVYAALFTALTDVEAGTVTEVTGGSYARQAITFGAPASRQTTNSGQISFPQASAPWGTVSTGGIYDAVSGGNLLYWGSLSSSRTVGSGDTFTFPVSSIVVSEAGFKTTFLSHAWLNHMLRASAYTPAATVYAALLTAVTDGPAGTVTEVSGGSYARQAIAWGASSGGATNNTGLITYPVASAGWGTVLYYGIYDALTVGNLLFWAALTTAKTINNGDVFTFAISANSITED